ncbi:sdcS [Symbiodinium necroappetens]|uniref:SdcS protein n=1 Tax=Symbiodinium necroappetens TaxID=1628268 RepID=A0A812RAK1_9DINO|nr:sdcS [Symbiodinium necroappetens]
METHVRVVARFRPPVTDEEFNDQPVFLLRPGDNSNAIDSGVAENATVESQDGRWTFEFDTAFSEEASQHVVYDRIGHPAVQDVLAGQTPENRIYHILKC